MQILPRARTSRNTAHKTKQAFIPFKDSHVQTHKTFSMNLGFSEQSMSEYIHRVFISHMAKKRSVLVFFLLLLSISTFSDIYGHPMFNSDEKFGAGYRIQVSKTPEFSQIGEAFQFRVRVTDLENNEVNGFTMGIRIFYNDQQIDTLFPKSFEGGHGDFNYIWRNQGNHVVKIDLYNVGEKKETVTFTFNIGTQSPYGYVLPVGITVGVLCVIGISVYVYLPKILKKSRP